MYSDEWYRQATNHYLGQCSQQKVYVATRPHWVNSLRPRQNGRHFADDVFKCNFLNENVWILIKISLKFVPKGPINNIRALVWIMVWHRTGDKPLSESMMTKFNDAYMRHSASIKNCLERLMPIYQSDYWKGLIFTKFKFKLHYRCKKN